MSKYWLWLPLLAVYLTSLGRAGFLGPDEPRYASIGREMARSHDWITPRLDGAPWFEKPPLLYWTTGIGHLLHLQDEWAARLPVALLSLAFLWFFHRTLAREFSPRVALAATGILATSAGWVAFSFAAVTDLPMAAALGAAMLIALFDTRPKQGFLAGALLGLAILAKAFVPLVLIAPVLLIARRKRISTIVGCVAVAAPWLVLCAWRYGSAFWDDFFWTQQVGRFLHPDRGHVQPWWFYLPVILGGLFPWTPLVALLARRPLYQDVRVRFLAFWLLFALAFFSASQNKLPGYALPLLPALAIVLAVACDKTPAAGWWIGSCVVLLITAPAIAALLPDALLSGVTSAHFSVARLARGWPFALAAGGVFWLAWWANDEPGRREQAMLAAALSALAAIVYFKIAVLPALDRTYSVREFWRANASRIEHACLEDVRRDWAYGLNYYAGRALPECTGTGPRISVRAGQLAVIEP